MKILVLSSRTGQALEMLNSLYVVHTAAVAVKNTTLSSVNQVSTPQTDEDWIALRDQDFDLAVSLGFMKHIPSLFFDHTLTINVHPGKLPDFKGKDPHIQALRSDARWTAVTIHKVAEEIDCGEILVEMPVWIAKESKPEDFEHKLRIIAVLTLASFLYGLEV